MHKFNLTQTEKLYFFLEEKLLCDYFSHLNLKIIEYKKMCTIINHNYAVKDFFFFSLFLQMYKTGCLEDDH